MKTIRDRFDDLIEGSRVHSYTDTSLAKHCADLAIEIAEQERDIAFMAGIGFSNLSLDTSENYLKEYKQQNPLK